MSDATEQPEKATPLPLEYATPEKRVRGCKVLIGLAASLFVSFGAGMTSFALSAVSGMREQYAAAMGVGVGFLVLGVMLLGLYWLNR